jgi:hypothetical protein
LCFHHVKKVINKTFVKMSVEKSAGPMPNYGATTEASAPLMMSAVVVEERSTIVVAQVHGRAEPVYPELPPPSYAETDGGTGQATHGKYNYHSFIPL